MKPAWRARPSRASPRISPTASWRRVLWGALLGLPGMVAYKAINTADSMIGHRTPRHEAFGCAAAKLDDVVNLPASRLAALLLALAAWFHDDADVRRARRDGAERRATRHRSPNAGWPEAAMAGALGLKLSVRASIMARSPTRIGSGRGGTRRPPPTSAARLAFTRPPAPCRSQRSGCLAFLIALI